MEQKTLDERTAAELETLMQEFPDWKQQYPDIYKELNPPRYTKLNRGSRLDHNDMGIKKRSSSLPNSHYKMTYKHHQQRPRSSKQPPPRERDPCPPAMTFSTNQRSDFVERDVNERAKLIKKEERYIPPEVPVDSVTNYMQDYPGHTALPNIVTKTIGTGQMARLTGKMNFDTTTKDHYKHWVPDRTITFGELPTFTDSILYPNQGRVMQTTTGTTFKGETGERRPPMPQNEPNIRIEGAHEMMTTTKSAYTKKEGLPPPKVTHSNNLSIGKRSKFNAQTSFKHDFGNFGPEGQPRPAGPIEPPPSTIQLQFDNRASFETEQRKEFQGIDIRKHPMTKSCKVEPDPYQPPMVKIQSETSQKRDFQPIDVQKAYVPPAKPPTSRRDRSKEKMETVSMSKHHFKNWNAPPPVRYGDFHESHTYVPPCSKFEGAATTAETFLGKPAPIPPAYLPKEQMKVGEGAIDFGSMYKQTFKAPNTIRNLSKSQAKALLQELRHRKAEMVQPQFSQPGLRAQ